MTRQVRYNFVSTNFAACFVLNQLAGCALRLRVKISLWFSNLAQVKYEGRLSSNWGSLSAPQMANRFWWIAAAGAYGMHGEMLYECPYWSDNSGYYCGQSVDKIAYVTVTPA